MCPNEYQYISSKWIEWPIYLFISLYSPLLCTWWFNLKPWKFLHQQILPFINEIFPSFSFKLYFFAWHIFIWLYILFILHHTPDVFALGWFMILIRMFSLTKRLFTNVYIDYIFLIYVNILFYSYWDVILHLIFS